MDRAWAGVDVGKGFHHVVAVGADGGGLFSQRVAKDERPLAEVIGKAGARAEVVTWAIDLHSSESALLVALLLDRGQTVMYLPGLTVNRAASSYRGASARRSWAGGPPPRCGPPWCWMPWSMPAVFTARASSGCGW